MRVEAGCLINSILLSILATDLAHALGWNRTLCNGGTPTQGEQVSIPAKENGRPLYSIETAWSKDLSGCKNKEIGCLNIQVVLTDATAIGTLNQLFLQVTRNSTSDTSKAVQGIFVSKPRSSRYINCDLGRNTNNNAITHIGLFGKVPRVSYVWQPADYDKDSLKDFRVNAIVSESSDGLNYFMLGAPVPRPPLLPYPHEDDLRNPFRPPFQHRPNQNRPIQHRPNQNRPVQHRPNQNRPIQPNQNNQQFQPQRPPQVPNRFPNQNQFNQGQNQNQGQQGGYRPGNGQFQWNDPIQGNLIPKPNYNNNNNNQWGPNQQAGWNNQNPNQWHQDVNNQGPNQQWANTQWGRPDTQQPSNPHPWGQHHKPSPTPDNQWGFNPWGSTLGPQVQNQWAAAFPGFVNPPNVNQFVVRPGFGGRPIIGFGGFNYPGVHQNFGGFQQQPVHQGQQGQHQQGQHQQGFNQQGYNPFGGNRDPYTATNGGHSMDDGRNSQRQNQPHTEN